jgi:hypothetical protein
VSPSPSRCQPEPEPEEPEPVVNGVSLTPAQAILYQRLKDEWKATHPGIQMFSNRRRKLVARAIREAP